MSSLPFLPHLEAIADAYDALGDDVSSMDCYRWSMLAADSVRRARQLALTFDISVTDDDESYPSAEAMIADVSMRRFVVSRANCEHPVWSPAENVAFRTVHDICGHYAASRDTLAGFDWEGENCACAAHFPLLGVSARIALFTECIARTGFAIARGGFGARKVGVIRGASGLEIAIDRVVFDGVAC